MLSAGVQWQCVTGLRLGQLHIGLRTHLASIAQRKNASAHPRHVQVALLRALNMQPAPELKLAAHYNDKFSCCLYSELNLIKIPLLWMYHGLNDMTNVNICCITCKLLDRGNKFTWWYISFWWESSIIVIATVHTGTGKNAGYNLASYCSSSFS